jgi:uracil-DNA glycosylase family 4
MREGARRRACYDFCVPARRSHILPDSRSADARFDASCRRCTRLVAFLDEVRAEHPSYHCAPVPPFGDAAARLLVVGLAPGMHGANATGQPFTGDFAGILLYRTLHEFGFANRPDAVAAGSAMRLADCRITNAVKCLPPANRPTPGEAANCNGYLAADLATLPVGGAVLALGRIAHDAVLRALGARPSAHRFVHGARHAVASDRLALFDSYHCSRYNTNTRRLTDAMFRDVVAAAAAHVRAGALR